VPRHRRARDAGIMARASAVSAPTTRVPASPPLERPPKRLSPRPAAPLRMLMLRATPPWTVSTTLTATWDSRTDPFDNNHLMRGLPATLP
jgi:hypothetical protein